MSQLRADFARVGRAVRHEGTPYVVTSDGTPVVRLVHPDETPDTKELRRVNIVEGRAYLTDVWESVQATGNHAVFTYHGKPRMIMVPYIEPEAA